MHLEMQASCQKIPPGVQEVEGAKDEKATLSAALQTAQVCNIAIV